MTEHHDPLHSDETDDLTLSPDDDAFVRSLLAELPAVAMPDDVVARIQAALAAEPDVELTAQDLPAAATTVVPLASRRRTSTPRLLQAAAAVVLVAGGGIFAVKALHHSSDESSSTAGVAAAAPANGDSSLPPLVTASGHDYSAGTMSGSVLALDSAASGRSAASAATPAPETAFMVPLTKDSALLTRCIASLQSNPVLPQRAISVDIGTFDHKPAVVVVVQSTDPKILTTYVTTPQCGTTSEPAILYYVNVQRP